MGKKRRLAIIIALTLSVSMCFNTGSVWAKKSLTELQKELQKTQEELDKGLKKENQLADKVVDLEKQVYELNGEIEVSEVKLQKLEKELKKAQEKVDLQNEELGGRLRNMYKNGNVGFVDVLMNSGSFSEFLTNLDLVQKIYASDKDVLEELQEAHDEVEQKKETQEKKVQELVDYSDEQYYQILMNSDKHTKEIDNKIISNLPINSFNPKEKMLLEIIKNNMIMASGEKNIIFAVSDRNTANIINEKANNEIVRNLLKKYLQNDKEVNAVTFEQRDYLITYFKSKQNQQKREQKEETKEETTQQKLEKLFGKNGFDIVGD